MRALGMLAITIEIIVSCIYHRGLFYQARYLTNWGLWSTWLTLLFGLFSTKEPPKDFMNRKYKNSFFQAWKWHTIFF